MEDMLTLYSDETLVLEDVRATFVFEYGEDFWWAQERTIYIGLATNAGRVF
jgi:hypothetical protein